jgi:SHS2 domain-containing protein
MSGRGHRTVPHTADLRLEAWAPTREGCLAEAVAALVESFAELPHSDPASIAERTIAASTDDDLLAAVLDEVIYRIDARGQLPVVIDVCQVADGVRLRFGLHDAGAATPTGPVPKAVALHALRLSRERAGRWSCTAMVDV